MKVLKMQKENSRAEKYNKTYIKWTEQQEERSEESLNLKID